MRYKANGSELPTPLPRDRIGVKRGAKASSGGSQKRCVNVGSVNFMVLPSKDQCMMTMFIGSSGRGVRAGTGVVSSVSTTICQCTKGHWGDTILRCL